MNGQRTLSVLLCDDNPAITSSLKSTIDWQSLHCKIIGTANSGNEAYDLAVSYQVDILITDIRMPDFTGLDLIGKLRVLLPDLKVILISGYDDFAYAKKGIEMGASRYILKPIDNNELQSAVRTVCKELETKIYEKNSVLSQNLNVLLTQLRSDFIRNIFFNHYSERQIKEKEISYNFSLLDYITFIITKKDGGNISKDEEILLRDIVESLLPKEKFTVISIYDSPSVVFFVNSQAENEIKKLDIKKILERILAKALVKLNTELIIGCSENLSGSSSVLSSYNQAKIASDSFYFAKSTDSVFIYKKNDELESEKTLRTVLLYSNELYTKLRRNTGDISEISEKICGEILKINNYETVIQLFKYLDKNITAICNEHKANIDSLKESPPINDNFIEQLLDFHTLTQALEFFKFSLGKVHTYLCDNNYSATINNLLDYLNKNYGEKLVLPEVCEKLSVSQAQLSRLIKKELSTTFIDLVNKIRLNNAVELLKQGDLKVYEIADKIGISNYAYFYMLFKKEYGVSPSDYGKTPKKNNITP